MLSRRSFAMAFNAKLQSKYIKEGEAVVIVNKKEEDAEKTKPDCHITLKKGVHGLRVFSQIFSFNLCNLWTFLIREVLIFDCHRPLLIKY